MGSPRTRGNEEVYWGDSPGGNGAQQGADNSIQSNSSPSVLNSSGHSTHSTHSIQPSSPSSTSSSGHSIQSSNSPNSMDSAHNETKTSPKPTTSNPCGVGNAHNGEELNQVGFGLGFADDVSAKHRLSLTAPSSRSMARALSSPNLTSPSKHGVDDGFFYPPDGEEEKPIHSQRFYTPTKQNQVDPQQDFIAQKEFGKNILIIFGIWMGVAFILSPPVSMALAVKTLIGWVGGTGFAAAIGGGIGGAIGKLFGKVIDCCVDDQPRDDIAPIDSSANRLGSYAQHIGPQIGGISPTRSPQYSYTGDQSPDASLVSNAQPQQHVGVGQAATNRAAICAGYRRGGF